MYGFRMRRRKTKEVLERSKNDVSISLFLVANTNFSPYRDIYIYIWRNVPREFKENIETRIRGRASKALSFLFPRRFGVTRDFSIRKPVHWIFQRHPWKSLEIEDLLFWIWFEELFSLAGFYYFISIVLRHCDSNEITDSFCSSFLIRMSLIFLAFLKIFLFVISFFDDFLATNPFYFFFLFSFYAFVK